MSTEDEDFLKRLLAMFRLEAEEHLQAMASVLSELEKPASAEKNSALVETLFREAHSLKGAARSVNLGSIETVCQKLESVLAALKRQEVALSPAFFDVLYETIDHLRHLLKAGIDAGPMPDATPLAPGQVIDTMNALDRVLSGTLRTRPDMEKPVAPAPAPAVQEKLALAPDTTGTVRISTAKLGSLLLQAEELLAFKFSAGHLAEELRTLHASLTEWKKTSAKLAHEAWTIRRNAGRTGGGQDGKQNARIKKVLDAILRDEFFAKSLGDRFALLERSAEHERRALAGMVDNLLEDMKQAMLLPFGTLLEVLPKLVRDLARDSGKEVSLVIDGESIEIDRRILEQMKAPLIHLIRNAIDHGIEMPAERLRNNKPQRGRISIDITPREGNQIELMVADDGAGINLKQVTTMAQKMGLLAPELTQESGTPDQLGLVFESGLSTSPILTDVSGRGLGLAIVREKVEKLGGNITAQLPAEGGTRFCIVLPTTLATFRGLLVALGERQFVLPSRNIERVTRVQKNTVKTVENRETIELDGLVLSLVHLSDVLGTARPLNGGSTLDYLTVAVLASAGKRAAFVVGEVIADQEVLVKGLGPLLQRVRNVAGATVLGAGRVVPILNVADLLKSAQKASPQGALSVLASTKPAPGRKSILVAEDSITSRSLLKNILKSAGYQVTVAVDGIDAFTTLHNGQFDLMVSDVEMPRMDGFDLTARVRADQHLSELPVVLVTALESREHKERGIDVGANAYIVKGSFDQSNLLEVIGRLI